MKATVPLGTVAFSLWVNPKLHRLLYTYMLHYHNSKKNVINMNDCKKPKDEVKNQSSKPGIQDGKYEGTPDAKQVEQEVKELNNLGAPGKQY